MVDVSSQSCTITPTSPDGLDPTGGAIVNGTVNVMIECRCVDNDGSVPNRIRWFDPTNTRVRGALFGGPYIIVNNNDAGRPTMLVIPTFSDSTSGVYTCGTGHSYPPGAMVTISLTIGDGKCYVPLTNTCVLYFMVPQFDISIIEIYVMSLAILRVNNRLVLHHNCYVKVLHKAADNILSKKVNKHKDKKSRYTLIEQSLCLVMLHLSINKRYLKIYK